MIEPSVRQIAAATLRACFPLAPATSQEADKNWPVASNDPRTNDGPLTRHCRRPARGNYNPCSEEFGCAAA